jgi:sugar O-acyltransferase (sialic acid O-acetyltransferase NeuD family)
MSVTNVVIFGSSGHAKVILDIIESNPRLQLIGFIDSFKPVGSKILGYCVIGNESALPELMQKHEFSHGVVGIGDNFTRKKIVESIIELVPDFQFINCIHPGASVSNHSELGVGNVVMSGVSVNADSTISDHCILNTNSSLDHDCNMAHFSSLAPNSAIGGNSRIGALSNVGIGSSVFHNVTIGENCIIGAGSLVHRDTESNATYYGVPARFISARKPGEKYL